MRPDYFEIIVPSPNSGLLLQQTISNKTTALVLQQSFEIGSALVRHGELLLSLASIFKILAKLSLKQKKPRSLFRNLALVSLLLTKISLLLLKSAGKNSRVKKDMRLIEALRGLQALVALVSKENYKSTLAEIIFRKTSRLLFSTIWKPSL